MTKEQYLVFKSDLKIAIETVKLFPNRFWKKVHHGFASEEEKQKAISEANKKKCELRKLIKVREKGYGDTTHPVIHAESCATHLAYYCAKHQLNDEQAYEYVKAENEKMTEPKKYNIAYLWSEVRDILKAYSEYEEKVVCTD